MAARSPLPGKSASAIKHGRDRHRSGFHIASIVRDYGAVSDSIGELGAREELYFSAQEYRIFNQCLDSAVAAALEEYWTDARAEQEHKTRTQLGSYAHELRNALSSAKMGFGILRQGEVGVNSKTGEVVARSLHRLEQLIDQMVVSTRARSELIVERSHIGIATLLRDLEAAAPASRGIAVVVEADETLAVDADERLLTTAISNLLQNAIKFTRDGGVVTLRARDAGEMVVIEVEDQCGGLPPGSEQELFAPFVQRSEDKTGLGLGLSITRDAVHAQGGQIAVHNLPGQGCIFTITLFKDGEPKS
jgi:signal transduction histidine kinase